MTSSSPARLAIKQADDGIATWLGDLISGTGSSPSHIIITGVLGVIPGVGQAMDARDLVLGIIVIAKSPSNVSGWVDLVITLIGCIPAVGDALKVGFKLMKQGHSFGRVLEAVSPKLRGNVEQFMRRVDWTTIGVQSKSIFSSAMDAFAHGLDTWVIKLMAGRREVDEVIAELRAIQRRGPEMIDAALAELKMLHGKMLSDALPRNTAAVVPSMASSRPIHSVQHVRDPRQEARRLRTERTLSEKAALREKKNNVSSNSTNSATKKKGEPKGRKWTSGVPAEHITDYFVRHKHTHFRKANNNGKLIEEHSTPHQGLDHLWRNLAGGRRFVVGETKSSIFDSFKLMAALPSELRTAFDALREQEALNPTKGKQPNIFQNEDRDTHADRRVAIQGDENSEAEIRKGLNKPDEATGLPTQMSHRWIQRRLSGELLTPQGRQLITLIRDWQDGEIDCPYNRWISLVTGRQLYRHRQSGGSIHQVQTVLNLPDNILEE
nr:hypothetical protein [uncultured Massilia sp.]